MKNNETNKILKYGKNNTDFFVFDVADIENICKQINIQVHNTFQTDSECFDNEFEFVSAILYNIAQIQAKVCIEYTIKTFFDAEKTFFNVKFLKFLNT